MRVQDQLPANPQKRQRPEFRAFLVVLFLSCAVFERNKQIPREATFLKHRDGILAGCENGWPWEIPVADLELGPQEV